MKGYYNLRTSLSGDDICDKTAMYVVEDGIVKRYLGKSRGFFRRGFDYSDGRIWKISKFTIIDNILIFSTGSGMVTIHFSASVGVQFHIFGDIQNFIDDIRNEIQMIKD